MNRRSLIKNFLVGAGSTALLATQRALAAELAHLDVKDPAAIAKAYVEDAGKVDEKKYPGFVKGSSCDNCLLLQGASGAGYRPCELFPGKLVAVKGWCSGWSAEI
jgi:hypothetical protein